MKKRFTVASIRFWEKQLRAPVAWTFFAIYCVIAFLYCRYDTVSLPSDAAPVTIASNQTSDDLRKTIKEAILSARQSVTLMIFSLSDYELIDALKKKSENDVAVTVIHDAAATPDIEWKLGPRVKVLKRHHKGLMHQKILVIDQATVFFGSVNFTRESLILHANLLIGIHSPELAREIEKKTTAILNHTPYIAPAITIQGREQAIEFLFLPDRKEALDKLVRAIDTAKKTVRVAMYTFTHPRLIKALNDAHDRGVDVQVVLDFDSAKQTSRKAFEGLKRHNNNVRVSNRNGLLHHKLCIIDNELLITGSANWTKAAFQSNDDHIAFITPLTPEQKEKLEALWKVIQHESKPSFTSRSTDRPRENGTAD